MPEEVKKAQVELVEGTPIDERLIKAFEKIAEKTYLSIQKRDYRATLVHREEKGGIDDTEAALIHINEDNRDEVDNPTELDYKGHITPYEAFMFKDVNYAMALAQLKDWAYFEEIEHDAAGNPKFDEIMRKDGSIEKRVRVIQIPINLAQIDMLSKKRLNMGVGGVQSWMHIHERRANAGMPPDETLMGKLSGWAGFKRERVSKEELEAQYGSVKK
jgi:hypothetical protein